MPPPEFKAIGGYECINNERRRYFQLLNWLGTEVRYVKLYCDKLHAQTINAGLLPSMVDPGTEMNNEMENLGTHPTDCTHYGSLLFASESEAISILENILEQADAKKPAGLYDKAVSA